MKCKTVRVCNDLRCYVTEFDNIVEMVRYVKDVEINDVFKNDELSSERHGTESGWLDFKTFGEALNVLEYGTDKYLTTFTTHFKLAKQYLDEHITKKVSGFKTDVAGFVPIVPNVLSGNPINMIASDVKPKKIPTARIYIDRATSCGYKAKDIITFESLVFALIQVLEDSGVRCEIHVVDTAYENKESIVTSLKIKDYSQPLNLYKIQFPIVSPDYFRRIGFRMIESEPEISDHHWTYGYGSPLATRRWG